MSAQRVVQKRLGLLGFAAACFVLAPALTAVPQPIPHHSGVGSFFMVLPHNFPGHRKHVQPTTQLQQWSGSFIDTAGQSVHFTMVGTDPATNNAPTFIPVVIVPVKMVYGPDNGNMTFDPKKHKVQNGKTVVDNILASPIFKSNVRYVLGGTDLGKTQYTDAFQRGNFWSQVKKNGNYHVLLNSPTVLPEQTITVQPSQGQVVTNPYGGIKVGTMDLIAFDTSLQTFMQNLSDINPGILPIFVTSNIYLWHTDHWVGGYHTATDAEPDGQTYAYATYVDEAGSKAEDVSGVSHEIGEWMDDPFADNLAPHCATDERVLEMADPMEAYGSFGTFPYIVNGFTYHLADFSFLSYFGASRKQAVNKWLDFQDQQSSICSTIVRYAFTGLNDGGLPSGLIIDNAGNLYGTTFFGGNSNGGSGVVFRVSPGGGETVLHVFTGTDGAAPTAALIADNSGNFYGTTEVGGSFNCCGTVFKLAPDGSETVLHSFAGGSDGYAPSASLVLDRTGMLYGTTAYGGGSGCFGYGCGTVFKVAPNGAETVLHSFSGGSEGFLPTGSLFVDRSGNLFGTTNYGGPPGCGDYGCGTVFEVTSNGTKTIVHQFNGSDGAYPASGLIADKKGNLYGVTLGWGPRGNGVVYRLAPDGTFSVLYAFGGGLDGAEPRGALVFDANGNLYGTTEDGGDLSCANGNGCGTIFEIAADGTKTTLYVLTRGDGTNPLAGVVVDSTGNIYGATDYGGINSECSNYGCGTIIAITK